MDLITELRIGPSYVLNSDEKELRNRAAEELERLTFENLELKGQVEKMNAMLIRERNK